MPQKGLLLVVSEPPAAFEEELNEWYDREHVPERLAIEGFLSAVRFVSAVRCRRYLALYDLAEIGVLQSKQYQAFAGDNFTPWTRRVVSRAKFTRVEAIQTLPGDASTTAAPLLLMLQVSLAGPDGMSQVEKAARHCFAGKPGVAQLRVFAGQSEHADRSYVIVSGVGDLGALVDPEAFREGVRLVDAETFLPY